MIGNTNYKYQQAVTHNIRKPGGAGIFNFCSFTKVCNGLTGLRFEIPAYVYYQRYIPPSQPIGTASESRAFGCCSVCRACK
jgi:hypothetical protein